MKFIKSLLFVLGFILLLFSLNDAQAQQSLPVDNFLDQDETQNDTWVSPPAVDNETHALKFVVQSIYQNLGTNDFFGLLDVDAMRKLDATSSSAEADIRLSKSFSNSDPVTEVDLRIARVSLFKSWLQISAGRFDVFQWATPNFFFGAYPLMGIHRVDGALMVVPLFSKSDPNDNLSLPPSAIGFFYSPSLLSASNAQYDFSQGFFMAQVRTKFSLEDSNLTFRANLSKTQSDLFAYSSLNGGTAFSVAGELTYERTYHFTAEYGVQNTSMLGSTDALALGMHVTRIGTWGDFSIDDVAVEDQIPLTNTLQNPFTGGNDFEPSEGMAPANSWYAMIKMRLDEIFIEVHVTNNQNDFTLARPNAAALNSPLSLPLGPGNETIDSQLPLRSSSHQSLATLCQIGAEF